MPAGTSLDVAGVTAFTTGNDGFYRIDTALRVPQVEPSSWSLRVHGLVEREVVLTWGSSSPPTWSSATSRWPASRTRSAGPLVGNARWLGLPVADLLARAGVRDGADMVLSRSSDGFTAGTPLEALADSSRGALLAVGMNGEPLPVRHGFPARLVVPGLYGYVSATKWVVDLEVTRFADARAYWTERGWSSRGPVRTQSRIDTPVGTRGGGPGRRRRRRLGAEPGGRGGPGADRRRRLAERAAGGGAQRRHLAPVGPRVGRDAGPAHRHRPRRRRHR